MLPSAETPFCLFYSLRVFKDKFSNFIKCKTNKKHDALDLTRLSRHEKQLPKNQSVNHTLDDMDYTRVQIRIWVWVWSDLLEFLHEMLPALCQLNASLIVPVCSLCKICVFKQWGSDGGSATLPQSGPENNNTVLSDMFFISLANSRSQIWGLAHKLHINHTETH